MFFLFILFVLSTTCCLGESRKTESVDIDEHILCRSCGVEISAANYLTVIASPHARQAVNETLFNNKWKEYNSLFPGYQWKVCICPSCGQFLGFIYDPITTETPSSAKPFYGLALPNVIGESYLDSFTKRPVYHKT